LLRQAHTHEPSTPELVTQYDYTDANHGDGFDAAGKVIDGEGALVGGQLGFNVQTGSFVWGVEGDLSWSGLAGSKRLLPYPINYPANGSPAWDFDNQINWLATVRARLGITSGSLLVYGTGGFAFAEVESHLDVVGPGYNAWGQRTDTALGWTGGGGLEWMISRSWTLKAEYLYVNLGSVGGILAGEQTTSCVTPCPHTTDGFGGDLDVHTVRVGVNYRFGASD
jgi:outer membrane immunogenic protein